jgi:hypothetical protein
MEQREKDIQELCKQVLNMEIEHYEDDQCRDNYWCPICDAYEGFKNVTMETIQHEPTCAYLIAKDLSSGNNT